MTPVHPLQHLHALFSLWFSGISGSGDLLLSFFFFIILFHNFTFFSCPLQRSTLLFFCFIFSAGLFLRHYIYYITLQGRKYPSVFTTLLFFRRFLCCTFLSESARWDPVLPAHKVCPAATAVLLLYALILLLVLDKDKITISAIFPGSRVPLSFSSKLV